MGLPVVLSWNSGLQKYKNPATYNDMMTPSLLIQQLESGYPVLPSFTTENTGSTQPAIGYYNDVAILRDMGLPLVFKTPQIDGPMLTQSAHTTKPTATNPQVRNIADTAFINELDPLASTESWTEIGTAYGSIANFATIAATYPNPPAVWIISNNEAARHRWINANSSKRFVDAHGTGKTSAEKRQIYGDGFITKYNAMLAAVKAALPASWQSVTKFSAYNTALPKSFGRFSTWTDYSLYVNGRDEPWYYVWDEVAPSIYNSNNSGDADYTLQSSQIEGMNVVPSISRMKADKPDLRIAIDLWDGVDFTKTDPNLSNHLEYENAGQAWSSERYKGSVRFIFWLFRASVYREFRSHTDDLRYYNAYWNAVLRTAREVWENDTLSDFWLNGTLYANTAESHPYQVNIPSEIASDNRWFQLTNDKNPTGASRTDLNTNWPVFNLAITHSDGRCLVYAHSPLDNGSSTTITTPNGNIIVNVPLAGAFYVVNSGGTVTETIT